MSYSFMIITAGIKYTKIEINIRKKPNTTKQDSPEQPINCPMGLMGNQGAICFISMPKYTMSHLIPVIALNTKLKTNNNKASINDRHRSDFMF